MRTRSKILQFVLVLSGLLLPRNTLATNADTEGRDAQAPFTALHQAARDGNIANVQTRLNADGQVDVRDSRDMTPLHYAAATGHIDVASLLLDRGADPNARAQAAMTPLHFAAMLGRAEMAGLLVRRGARTDAKNSAGLTALHLAADDKVVHALAVAGADVNAKTDQGLTPLHTARQGSVARALLDAGADLRIRTPKGRTAMELAAIESLEPAGLSIHSVMLGRLRGLIGAMPVTLTNITAEPIQDLVLAAHGPACEIEIEPARLPQLLPGENAEFTLAMTRSPSVPEGEHPVYVTISAAGRKLGNTDLKVDTRMGVTLEDRGMIRLAKGQIRQAPSRWFYLVYASVPLLVVGAWYFLRKRPSDG